MMERLEDNDLAITIDPCVTGPHTYGDIVEIRPERKGYSSSMSSFHDLDLFRSTGSGRRV